MSFFLEVFPRWSFGSDVINLEGFLIMIGVLIFILLFDKLLRKGKFQYPIIDNDQLDNYIFNFNTEIDGDLLENKKSKTPFYFKVVACFLSMALIFIPLSEFVEVLRWNYWF